MKDGRCTRCQSERVFKKRVDRASARINISTFHDAVLTIFVCADCGFTERYLLDDRALAAVATKWTPALD